MECKPEIGQVLFGNPHQRYKATPLCEACMSVIGEIIAAKLGLRPMENSGDRFDCDSFSAHAYDWGDDDQPWNFKWRNFEVSWYKYLGRGTSMNMALTTDVAAEMLVDCISGINQAPTCLPSRCSDNAER